MFGTSISTFYKRVAQVRFLNFYKRKAFFKLKFNWLNFINIKLPEKTPNRLPCNLNLNANSRQVIFVAELKGAIIETWYNIDTTLFQKLANGIPHCIFRMICKYGKYTYLALFGRYTFLPSFFYTFIFS